jgi:CAAX prenyl protease-like protein
VQDEPPGYNPFQEAASFGFVLAGIRVFGAAVVVPLTEELFWRSFLIRFLIKSSYTSVPLGSFTLLSFVATVVLFGLEHHLWLAGMMAGVAYNLLLYKTGRLWPCIVAHALTNLILSIHVLVTREWQWW